MRKFGIRDLKPGAVAGVEVLLPPEMAGFKQAYFEWTSSELIVKFGTNEISGGVLRSWHHVPVFSEIETHGDYEMFYFVSGVALMLFTDVKNDQPQMDTVQIVRIQPGTQIIIAPGKAHFVPVAEGSDPLFAVVVSPKMTAPRLPLPESVEGVA